MNKTDLETNKILHALVTKGKGHWHNWERSGRYDICTYCTQPKQLDNLNPNYLYTPADWHTLLVFLMTKWGGLTDFLHTGGHGWNDEQDRVINISLLLELPTLGREVVKFMEGE